MNYTLPAMGEKTVKLVRNRFVMTFICSIHWVNSLPFESGTQFTFQIRSKNRINGLKTSQMTLVVENQLIEFHAI